MMNESTKIEGDEQSNEYGSSELNYSEDGRDSTLPSLDEYLESRLDDDEPKEVKFAKIIGIDIHVNSLAILQFISILLLVGVMFLNFSLNYDSDFFKGFETELPKIGWQGSIFINCILITPLILLMAWSYNFIKSIPELIISHKYRRLSEVLYILAIIVFFIIFIIYALSNYGYIGPLIFILLVLLTPFIFGLTGILVKFRAFNILAFIGIFIVCISQINDSDEILELIFFAAILLLYFDISDTTIKFSKISQNLWPGRDDEDIELLNKTTNKYLINVFIFLSLTCILALILFNTQLILSFILPKQIVYSLEFQSPIFLILILIIIIVLISIFKKYLPKVLFKNN